MFHVGLHVCNIIYCVNPAYYLLIESINQSNFSDRIPQFCSFLPVYNVASYDIWHYYAYVNWYMWMSQYQTFILQWRLSQQPPLSACSRIHNESGFCWGMHWVYSDHVLLLTSTYSAKEMLQGKPRTCFVFSGLVSAPHVKPTASVYWRQ